MEKITLKTTIGEALKNEKAVAAIEELKPGITKNPAVNMFKKLTLERLPLDHLHITQEQLEEMIEKVNAED